MRSVLRGDQQKGGGDDFFKGLMQNLDSKTSISPAEADLKLLASCLLVCYVDYLCTDERMDAGFTHSPGISPPLPPQAEVFLVL